MTAMRIPSPDVRIAVFTGSHAGPPPHAEAAEAFELPGADLSHEELTVRVLPRQADEFTCASCFLVKSGSQEAERRGDLVYCIDCV